MRYLASHEKAVRGTFDFPIQLYYVDAAHPRYEMPFHWHMEHELILVLQGVLHLSADGFRGVYATVAAFMWMATGWFSPEYFTHYRNRNRYYFFNLMTLGATLGVFLSDDLYTTLIFFEIMSLTSYVWVAQEETPGALRAGATYLAVAIIGGLTTLMGLFLLYHQLGTLSFEGMKAATVA